MRTARSPAAADRPNRRLHRCTCLAATHPMRWIRQKAPEGQVFLKRGCAQFEMLAGIVRAVHSAVYCNCIIACPRLTSSEIRSSASRRCSRTHTRRNSSSSARFAATMAGRCGSHMRLTTKSEGSPLGRHCRCGDRSMRSRSMAWSFRPTLLHSDGALWGKMALALPARIHARTAAACACVESKVRIACSLCV